MNEWMSYIDIRDCDYIMGKKYNKKYEIFEWLATLARD